MRRGPFIFLALLMALLYGGAPGTLAIANSAGSSSSIFHPPSSAVYCSVGQPGTINYQPAAINSPVAGTLVATASGLRPIETIQTNEWVWSWDSETGQTNLNPVETTYVRTAPATVTLQIGDSAITSTLDHPFWVVDQGWTLAGQLHPGDVVLTLAGTNTPILSEQQHPGWTTVYNLKVAHDHSYFVSPTGVLVHNANYTPGGTLAENQAAESESTWQRLTYKPSGLTYNVRTGEGGRLEEVFAQIKPQNIGKGSATTDASRGWARMMGNALDDAGHGIGSNLGGPGGVRGLNIFSQNLSVNRGAFRAFEEAVADEVEAGNNVFVRVKFNYSAGTRPDSILYQVRVNGKTTRMLFQNPP